LLAARILLAALSVVVWSIPTTSYAAAQSGQGYRLAGTVAVGGGYLAFLEVPGGTQVLVRKGDVAGAAQVLDVRDRAIDLKLPGGRIELTLEATDKPAQSGARSDNVVTSQSDEGHVVRREVAVEPMKRELSEGGPDKAGRAPGTTASAAVTQRFAPVINLPPNSSIVAINGHAVTSEDGAVREVTKALAMGAAVTMNLKTPAGLERVYLLPAPAEPTSTTP
jgi:hypothetical protein